MDKNIERRFTERLEQIDTVITTGVRLGDCMICHYPEGFGCIKCPINHCLDNVSVNRNRNLMYDGTKKERIAAAKRHKKWLLKKLDEAGYEYE